MRSATAMAIVVILTGAVLSVIAASGSFGGEERDCAECHSPGSAQGDYVLEQPGVFVGAPTGISAGDTFQVLVILSEPAGYDLASATSSIDLSGLPGSGTVGDGTIMLERNGTTWQGAFRVRAGDGGGTILVTIICTAHHDHYRSEDPDVATLRIERDVEVQVGPPEDGGDGPSKDAPMGAVPVALGISSILWWRAWKRERRTP